MKRSEVNHLRLLLGWIRCEIGPTPDEWVATVKDVASKLGNEPVSDEGRQRLVHSYDRFASVPKYVRAAEKALSKMLADQGEIVDAEAVEPPRAITTAARLPGASA